MVNPGHVRTVVRRLWNTREAEEELDGWLDSGRKRLPPEAQGALAEPLHRSADLEWKEGRGSYQGHHQEATKTCPAVVVSWGHQEQPEEYQGG